jgi:hypothetical protein
VKPLSIVSLYTVFLQVLFIVSGLVHDPYKQSIIISDLSFLKISFSLISDSEFLVLTHNFPRMIVLRKKYQGKVKFLEC